MGATAPLSERRSLVGVGAVRISFGVPGEPAGASAGGITELLGPLLGAAADRPVYRPTRGGGLRAISRRVEAGPDAVSLRAARSDAIGAVAGGIQPDAVSLHAARSQDSGGGQLGLSGKVEELNEFAKVIPRPLTTSDLLTTPAATTTTRPVSGHMWPNSND